MSIPVSVGENPFVQDYVFVLLQSQGLWSSCPNPDCDQEWTRPFISLAARST
jgi:hypothetical protein